MRNLNIITLTILAALGAASTASADCAFAYQEKMSSLDLKYNALLVDGGAGAMFFSGWLVVVPGAITAGLTTTNRVKFSDRKQVLNLIKDSKQGYGLELIRFTERANSRLNRTLAVESVAEVINELNQAKIFCAGNSEDVLPFSEVEELILFKLKASS